MMFCGVYQLEISDRGWSFAALHGRGPLDVDNEEVQ